MLRIRIHFSSFPEPAFRDRTAGKRLEVSERNVLTCAHGTISKGICRLRLSKSRGNLGFISVLMPIWGGMAFFWNMRSTFSKAVVPAQDSLWPTFDFTPPILWLSVKSAFVSTVCFGESHKGNLINQADEKTMPSIATSALLRHVTRSGAVNYQALIAS